MSMSVNMHHHWTSPHETFGYYSTPWPNYHQHQHQTIDNRSSYSYINNYGSQSSSSNRHMRNMAEKMRRDKLNFFIGELSTLVPIISFSPKKLDKTSILRLAATYIRLHNVIFGSVRRDRRSPVQSPVHRQMLEYLPQYLASFNWSENVLEEMDGMLMIVNGAGRIIFISHTVEKLLGHTQIELMGQSLYNLTCLEDYDELKRNLAPDDDFANANSSEAGGEDSRSSCDSLSSGSTSTAPPPTRLPTLPFHLDSDGSDQRLRRSFYIRLRQRAQSRSDQPQYELVHVFGHLRVPPRAAQQASSHQQQNLNDVILVAVVKPFKEKRITTLSLMEACREEFITRHTLDGRIIYTDHRISIVAGYLAEEVCGIPGFQYMHKEDMRWTMVGLRQMYFRGSSYGQSCYRLQTKNGNFIYLKTCGYLELSESNDSFQSLICINSLVSPTEGESLIRQMKDQYSPVIKNKDDRTMEILSSNIQMSGKTETAEETEDPKVLEQAISQMISNVPNPSPFGTADTPNTNVDPSNAAKAALVAKALPPLSIQIKKIGIVPPIIRTPAAVAASLSPPSSHHSPPLKVNSPPPPQAPPQQDRPSVLRVARQGGQTIMSVPDHSSLKRMRTDERGGGVVMASPAPAHTVVVSPPPGSKRKSEDTDWPEVVEVSLSPSTSSVSVAPTSPALDHTHTHTPSVSVSPNFHLDQLLTDELSDLTTIMQDDNPSPTELVNNLDDLQEMYPFGWGQPGVSEILLESSHTALDTQMQRQEDQMNVIGQELEMVPPDHSNGQVYNSKLTQLQVEHRKQQQMLKTLQQDHQSIQQLGVCTSQPDSGF